MSAIRPNKAQFIELMEAPDEGPVVMLNLLKFKEKADGAEGTGASEYGKYGDAANLPVSAMKKKTVSSALKASGGGGSNSGSKVHKPHLDEMHGPESLPYRENQSLPSKPLGSTSRIIQPTDSRQSGPEFGPAPKSTGGMPGRRGGWKKR